jgi:hypothetical protein
VSIEVVVTRGGSLLGIDIEGPGACSGANAGAGPAGPGMAPTSEVMDCGEVAPANVPLELSTLGGYVRGYLVLRGMTAA